MSPRFRPCGNPACHICRWQGEEHEDSGEPESLASLLLATAAVLVLFMVAFFLLPVLA